MASTYFNRASLAGLALASAACSGSLEPDQRLQTGISRAQPASEDAGAQTTVEPVQTISCDELAERAPAGAAGTALGEANMDPTRAGEQYSLIWGQDASNVWAIGAIAPQTHGEAALDNFACDPNRFFAWSIAKHFDGSVWSTVDFPSTTRSNDLHGSAADNVWVVGATGEAWQFNGSQWQLHDLRAVAEFEASSDPCEEFALTGVWAQDRDDVWVVGYVSTDTLKPLLMHYDGEHWTRHAVGGSDALLSVWASDREHAWVVGTRGMLQSFTGKDWQTESKLTESDLTTVYGASPRSVWVAGASDTLARFDGKHWKTGSAPQDFAHTQGMVARGSDDLWMLNGGVVSEGDHISYVQSIDHWDGAQWCSVRSTTTSEEMFSDLWISREGHLWAAGNSLRRLL